MTLMNDYWYHDAFRRMGLDNYRNSCEDTLTRHSMLTFHYTVYGPFVSKSEREAGHIAFETLSVVPGVSACRGGEMDHCPRHSLPINSGVRTSFFAFAFTSLHSD